MLYLFEKNSVPCIFVFIPQNNKTTNNGKINRTPTLHAVVRLLQRPTAAEKRIYRQRRNKIQRTRCVIEPPLTPEAGSNIHEVFPPNGKQVRAFALEQPVAETDEWVMIGLRASYDYISPDEYRSAGKAFQILYWDEHSHLPRVWHRHGAPDPIMKKCPNCGNDVPSRFHRHHRTDTQRRRNPAGACLKLPRNLLRTGGRLPRSRRDTGRMCGTGSF